MTTESDKLIDKNSRTTVSKKLRQRLFLEAFASSMGNVTNTCKQLGINRQTYYDWMADPKFAEKVRVIVEEETVDFMESKLFQLQNGVKVRKLLSGKVPKEVIYDTPPNVTAVIFGLKCKGKHRNWVERQEVVEIDLIDPVDLSKLTYEELRAYKERKLPEQKLRAIVAARECDNVGNGIEEEESSDISGDAEPESTAI